MDDPLRTREVYDDQKWYVGTIHLHSVGNDSAVALLGEPLPDRQFSMEWDSAVRDEISLCFEAGIDTVWLAISQDFDTFVFESLGWRAGRLTTLTNQLKQETPARWWACDRVLWLRAINAHLN